MRALLLGLASATALVANMDAREIVRRAVAADERNWKVARNYGFSERVDARRLDSQGQLKSKDVTIYDVTLLEGSPYRRLAGRDDRPLPPGDEKKEREKLAQGAPPSAGRRQHRSGRFAWPSTRVVRSGNARPGTRCRRLSTSV
jgi:hypothetical protein